MAKLDDFNDEENGFQRFISKFEDLGDRGHKDLKDLEEFTLEIASVGMRHYEFDESYTSLAPLLCSWLHLVWSICHWAILFVVFSLTPDQNFLVSALALFCCHFPSRLAAWRCC